LKRAVSPQRAEFCVVQDSALLISSDAIVVVEMNAMLLGNLKPRHKVEFVQVEEL
jgi:hypothetical protein